MSNFILVYLAIAVGLNLLVFLFAYLKQTDKLTDITWATTFIVLATIALARLDQKNSLNVLLTLMVYVWALRLGGFLLVRVLKHGKDSRFDDRRSSFFGFMKFWIGQGFTAWVMLLPIFFANNLPRDFSLLTWFGFAIWIVGIAMETTADFQKYYFTSKPENTGKWIDKGLWHYSRHPNYFGEMLIWSGLYIFCYKSLVGIEIIYGLASPLLIISLLRFVTGVPILEQMADKRWGSNPAYKEYRRSTGLLLPIRKN